MSDDTKDLGHPPSSADGDPDPQFMKEFQEVIGTWAEATSGGNTQAAQDAAMKALQMAGEQALKHPTPSLLLKEEADDLPFDEPYALLALARALERLGKISRATGDFAGEELVLNEARRIRTDLKLFPYT